MSDFEIWVDLGGTGPEERQQAGRHTFGVCDLTFPARAREPWTLPMIAGYLLMNPNSIFMLDLVVLVGD